MEKSQQQHFVSSIRANRRMLREIVCEKQGVAAQQWLLSKAEAALRVVEEHIVLLPSHYSPPEQMVFETPSGLQVIVFDEKFDLGEMKDMLARALLVIELCSFLGGGLQAQLGHLEHEIREISRLLK